MKRYEQLFDVLHSPQQAPLYEFKNPDAYVQEEAVPLFRGQNTHPLTQYEMKRFFDRLDIRGRRFTDDEQKIKKAFEAMAQTPTGREQIRQIIRALPSDRIFEIRHEQRWEFSHLFSESRTLGPQNAGGYVIKMDSILLPNIIFNMSPNELGNTLLHELNHARNYTHVATAVLLDAETQALSAQLTIETNNKRDCWHDSVNLKNYHDNLVRWRIIAKNPNQRPQWAFLEPFEYIPSPAEKQSGQNNPEREAAAREMYARQMASIETRTQFMEDFYISSYSLNQREKSSSRFSYMLHDMSRTYKKKDLSCVKMLREKHNADFNKEWDIDEIWRISRRYPSLNTQRMLRRAAEINAEYHAYGDQITQSLSSASPLDTTPNQITQMDEAVKKQRNEELEQINKDRRLSPNEKIEKKFLVYKKYAPQTPVNDTITNIWYCICRHQQNHPELNEARIEMIEYYKQVSGHNIPISSNNSQKSSNNIINNSVPTVLTDRFNQIASSVDANQTIQNEITNLQKPNNHSHTV